MSARLARVVSAGMVLVLLAVAETALAEGFKWPSCLTVTKTETKPLKPYSTVARKEKQPSAFEKLGEDTKKFFSGAAALVTPKKPAAKKAPSKPASSWFGSSNSSRNTAGKSQKSWFASLFEREEPKPAESLDDFMNLERLDP